MENLLFENLYGNIATLYHRFENIEKIKKIFNGSYKNLSAIDFKGYKDGIYTTIDMDSQLSKKGYTNMKETYGSKILKLVVKDLTKFMFLDFKYYKKYFKNAREDTFIKEQLDKFGLTKYFKDFPNFVFDHVGFSRTIEQHNLFNKVAGVIYYGRHDGDCCLIYNNKAVMPISVSFDEGKTWESFKSATSGISKEERKSRFEEYKKGFSPSNNKEKTIRSGMIPSSILKKAMLNVNYKNLFAKKSKLMPNSKVYYKVTKGEDGKDKYSFYINGKLFQEFDYGKLTSPFDGRIITTELGMEGRVLNYAVQMMKNGEYSPRQRDIQNAKDIQKASGYKKYVVAYVNNKFKKERRDLKLLSITNVSSDIASWQFYFAAYNKIYGDSQFNVSYESNGKIEGVKKWVDKELVIKMIEEAISQYKKLNKDNKDIGKRTEHKSAIRW